jgi:hypothetical protein
MSFSSSRSAPVFGTLSLICLFLVSPTGVAQDTPEQSEKKPMKEEKGKRGGFSDNREKWEKLSEQDREKLKVALRDVWADPAVLSAREEVNEATKAFQEAIRIAMTNADPAVAELLKEVQSPSRGPLTGRSPGRPGGQRHMGEAPTGPPVFFEEMTPEERAQFRKVEAKARESEAVLTIRNELEAIQREDEQLRRKRMETYRKMRRVVLAEMMKEDPTLGDKIAELGALKGPGGKGGPEGEREKER